MQEVFDELFEKLYLAHFKDLFKYVYRLTYEKNIAEEILQDTFTEAYRKIDLLAKHENPAGWLYVTARNITKSYMRDYLSIKAQLPLDNHDFGGLDDESDELFLSNYLSEEEARIIIRFYVDKMSLTELAEEYGISLSACKMRLKRARDKLKEGLKELNYL